MNFVIVLVYAIIVIAGGVFGYLKAGSQISLIMGLCFGVLLLISAWGISRKSTFFRIFAIILALILSCFFGYRYFWTSGILPVAAMAVVSIVTTLVLLFNKDRNE